MPILNLQTYECLWVLSKWNFGVMLNSNLGLFTSLHSFPYNDVCQVVGRLENTVDYANGLIKWAAMAAEITWNRYLIKMKIVQNMPDIAMIGTTDGAEIELQRRI